MSQNSAYVRIGQEPRLFVNFTDLNGAAIDPTTVTLQVKTPDGTTSTYTPTHGSTGYYYYDFLVTQTGTHYFRFAGSGAAVGADEWSFTVPSSQFS